MTSLTGYSRSLPAAYCGVAISHCANEFLDDDMVRTPMTVLPPYTGVDDQPTQDYQSQSLSVVSDAMSQQLLPNASTSSSSSSTSSSTWRPPTSTTELWSSTQRSTATTGRRDGPGLPAVWPGRPLPAPPTGLDQVGDLELELTAAIPRVDRDRLRNITTLGVGHFGEVSRFSLRPIICLCTCKR